MRKMIKPHKVRKTPPSTGLAQYKGGKDKRFLDMILYQSMLGNPTAKRMTGEDDRYIPAFGQGDRSNIVLGSYDNYATPSIMNIGGELVYTPNPWAVFPEWMVQNQSFKFNNPNDAIDFAESYKYSSPAFPEFFGVDNSVNYDKGKDGSVIQNTAAYNQWRSTLPKNLQTETPDYDLYGAFKAGLQPEWNDEDKSYHLGSRDPKTGRILKKPGHPTFGQTIYNDMLLGYYPIYKDGEIYTENPFEYNKGKDSGIHIKKANRGKFTAAAKRAGMGVQAYARKILSAPKGKYSPTLRRRAAFAKAASKFKH